MCSSDLEKASASSQARAPTPTGVQATPKRAAAEAAEQRRRSTPARNAPGLEPHDGYDGGMFIEAIETSGLAGLPKGSLSLERATRLAGTPRARLGLTDALRLAFGAWDRDVLAGLLTRWGCEGVEITGDPLPEGAHWQHAPGLGAVLESGDGLVTVSLNIVLDPPQYGKLRKLAARDARLIDALADGALLRVRVGARFSQIGRAHV